MGDQINSDSMLEMFIFETEQYLEQLEQAMLCGEESNRFSQTDIDEVFRVMHNIKSSSAMMQINNISELAHSIEDLFFFLREQKPRNIDYSSLSDLIFEGIDLIKVELQKVKNGDPADGDIGALIENINEFLTYIRQRSSSTESSESKGIKEQQKCEQDDCNSIIEKIPLSKTNIFKAVVYFSEGCEMENIRAYTIIHQLKDFTQEVYYLPEELVDDAQNVQIIREHGFQIFLKTERTYDEMLNFFNQTIFFKDLELVQLENDHDFKHLAVANKKGRQKANVRISREDETTIRGTEVVNDKKNVALENGSSAVQQSIISVNITKLDQLMDLVGEMVIAEAMVTQNPDLCGLQLDNFKKAATQLRKITDEVQDIVMSIRMLPLDTTFQKMKRIIRDMSKKLHKEVELEIVGEETEVDKKIIEHISDPLMHLVRNAVDHGLETPEERQRKGKMEPAKVTLEARNAGNEVLIMVSDNGKGLNKEKILARARGNGLLTKPEDDMTDREIFYLIFIPGFSTKDNATEFSGRGVGMDVVINNIEAVGGTVMVDSILDQGTTITLKIPLTLAIIDGMNISVGKSCYTIPIHSIKECFRPRETDLISDLDGKEMIMVRGQCYPILRLHEVYNVQTEVSCLTEGILVMVEDDEKMQCIFADKLLGEQQVVVKALPDFIKSSTKKRGLAGCTLLGDSSISLILDVAGLFCM